MDSSLLLANLIEANSSKLTRAGDVDRNLITKMSFSLKQGHSPEAQKELGFLGLSASSTTIIPRKNTDADWHSISEYILPIRFTWLGLTFKCSSVEVARAPASASGSYQVQPTSQGTLDEVVGLSKGLHKDGKF